MPSSWRRSRPSTRWTCCSISRSSSARRSTASSRRRASPRADRAHDPALPGELAEHAHRRHVDPAVDPRVAHRPGLPRADAQPDDAGGLSLAVGILVDDATVEIENVHRNMAMKKPLVQAILDGAQQIAVPAFVATLCICIVFIPVVFISGAARSLFTPLGMAVVFAMMMSYFLSRTLVPTMVHYLLGRRSTSTRAIPAGARPRSATSSGASTSGSTALRALRRALRRLPRLGARPQADRHPRLRRLRRGLARGALSEPRARLLPVGRRRADSLPRAHQRRHPHRDDRAAVRARRGRSSGRHPEGRDRDGHRQHRPADQRPEPRAGRPVDDLVGRRRGPDPARARSTIRRRSYVKELRRASRSTSRRPSSSSSRPTSRRRCSTSGSRRRSTSRSSGRSRTTRRTTRSRRAARARSRASAGRSTCTSRRS
jgi:hypothetical protein